MNSYTADRVLADESKEKQRTEKPRKRIKHKRGDIPSG